jgi:nucleolar protein 14
VVLSSLVQKKRKQRMLGGLGSDEDEDEDESDEDEEQSRRKQKKKRREISGDDLGENFELEDEYQEKGWVDEVLARKDDSDEDEDEDDEDEEGSGDGSEEDDEAGSEEGSDDEDGSEGSEDWERSEDELEGIEGIPKLSAKDQDLLDKLLAAKKGPKPEKEFRNLLEKESKVVPQKAKKPLSEVVHELDDALPYVIDAPQTLVEFRQLVDHRSIEDLEIAVERIRKCNAISLAAENRKKMQVCSQPIPCGFHLVPNVSFEFWH